MRTATLVLVASALLTSTPAYCQQTPALSELSLTDLLNIEITSVSHKQQQVGKTAAAVYVITQQDIKRSGATTLPDVLRMAPGFSVAQLNASAWSVTSRGFGAIMANKLLVLVDGRSVYNISSGGVNWEMQLIPLDMIDQIEIVRGPGGSLWGANAINGVVNIITKTPDQMQGGQVSSHASGYSPGTYGFSYGGRAGQSGYYVTRGQYVQRGSPGRASAIDSLDAFYVQSRADWTSAGGDRYSASADAQRGEQMSQSRSTLLAQYGTEASRRDFTQGNATFSWTRSASSRVETAIQAYYTGFSRDTFEFDETWRIADLDVRQRRALGSRHELVIGSGYRVGQTTSQGTAFRRLDPPNEWRHLPTAFAQDEITLAPRWSVTPGVKLEYNSDTGLEVQPSVRTIWTPGQGQSVWAAFSRGVRTPNRYDIGLHNLTQVIYTDPLPIVVTLEGSPTFRSEVQHALETGYRIQRGAVSFDAALFAAHYDNLIGGQAGQPSVGIELNMLALRMPIVLQNLYTGRTRGGEVAATWSPLPWWRTAGSYSHISLKLEDPAGNRIAPDGINGPVPKNEWQLRQYIDLPHDVDVSATFAHVGAIPEIPVSAYHRLDTRVAWSLKRRVEIAAGVHNLLRDRDAEYRDLVTLVQETSIRPDVYGSLSWKF